jgi:thiamine monophosphate synthase
MFIIKSNYYLYIENTENIDLNSLKKNKKISIIYRNNKAKEDLEKIYRLKKQCTTKKFKLYIANDFSLFKDCKADGLYLSSFNKKIYLDKSLNLIGSAHSFKEINEKIKQGCKTIFLSRLFHTDYKDKKQHFGLIKFNLLISKYKISIIPLGGIKNSNLNKLKLINSNGLALLSELKKKPAISSRLF